MQCNYKKLQSAAQRYVHEKLQDIIRGQEI